MPPNKQIEAQYNELKKRHKLPEFREIDNEFEISDLEDTNFLLRAVIRRIAERLDFYATVLQETLQPDTSNLYAMHETRFFDEDEKLQMYNLYTTLMNCNRQSIEVSLGNNEHEEAEFISALCGEWKSIKQNILKYIKKMRASWSVEADVKEELGYLG